MSTWWRASASICCVLGSTCTPWTSTFATCFASGVIWVLVGDETKHTRQQILRIPYLEWLFFLSELKIRPNHLGAHGAHSRQWLTSQWDQIHFSLLSASCFECALCHASWAETNKLKNIHLIFSICFFLSPAPIQIASEDDSGWLHEMRRKRWARESLLKRNLQWHICWTHPNAVSAPLMPIKTNLNYSSNMFQLNYRSAVIRFKVPTSNQKNKKIEKNIWWRRWFLLRSVRLLSKCRISVPQTE